jgi:hypothetical protein
MYISTVLLNCVASGIPVVALGWYPTVWRRALEQASVARFADSLAQAVEALTEPAPGGEAPSLDGLLAPAS